MNAAPVNQFSRYWEMGYKTLVPVIPPGVSISQGSSLFKRIGTKQDARGKVPGIKGSNGDWFSFDWTPHVTTEDNLARWHSMGAGVGIKTGNGLIAIDADTMDEASARIILNEVKAAFGTLPLRVGNYPKALYLARASGPLQYQRIEFGPPLESGKGRVWRVEILTEDKFFVAEGTHPKTGQPYRWINPLVSYDDLPVFDPEAITALLNRLRPQLPECGDVKKEGGATGDYDQDGLKGDLEEMRKAVRATPNTTDLFPSRESYRDYGYAIKAALADHPEEAFDLWTEWGDRWDGGDNDHDVMASDWSRMKPPFRRGADWVYDLAVDASGGAYQHPREKRFFQDEGDAPGYEPPKPDANKPQPIKWTRPSEWAGRTPAEREWEVEGWIPRYEVCLLYGDGGIGKTLAIHQYATAAAAGVDWLGQKTRQARVMCFFCEDSEDELLRRQIDINALLGVTFEDTDERLRIASRKYMDNLLALWDRNSGAMKRQAVWDQLLADAVAFKADVLVVDTIADTYGGNEIDRAQVNAFVKSCLGRLAQEIGGTVIALGHPSMSGKQSGSGTSGSTAWSNAVRSRMYLRYPKGVEKGNVRELEGMKLNYGPKGALLKLRWERGAFEVIASNVPATRSAVAEKRERGASVEEAARDALVAAVRMCEGVPLNMKSNSPHYAVKVLRSRQGDLLEAFSTVEVEAELRRMEGDGTLAVVEVGRTSSRHPVYGYAVKDNVSAATDLFE